MVSDCRYSLVHLTIACSPSYTHTHTHTVPPVFSVEPNDISVMESQFFTPPRCTANGDPVPTITWLRPSGINIPVQGGVPQFGALTRDDSGTYVCVASNSAGDVRSEFEITVQGEQAHMYTCNYEDSLSLSLSLIHRSTTDYTLTNRYCGYLRSRYYISV